MKNFIQPGDVLTFVAPAGGVVSGDGVVNGSLFGVAAYTAGAGAEVEANLIGVFALPKTAGALALGVKAYWDGAAVTGTATGNRLIGAVAKAAGAGDATVRVRLNGVSV